MWIYQMFKYAIIIIEDKHFLLCLAYTSLKIVINQLEILIDS
jgi:hypothetical protein